VKPPLAPGVYRYVTAAEHAGQRLDLFLAGVIGAAARGQVRRLIDLGGAHVDGRRVRRCSLQLTAGQQVELYVDGLPLAPFQLDPTRVLYRDRYLLALDKPSGIASQPTPARYQGTLYAALQQYLGTAGRVSLGMVQRLDRDSSGVMIFSIHPAAHKGLTAAFAERRVVKRYLALVQGHPRAGAGEIRSLLARRRATNRMVSVQHGGKPAITRYRVLATGNDAAVVEVEILTGRSHQIRLHFAEAGHPLLGDTAYGGPATFRGAAVPRQMLHASDLLLDHPVTGARLHLQAPLPDDFRTVQHLLADDAVSVLCPAYPVTGGCSS
jgi:23S rRNA pseudouridine1911/1915/1917 synthase